MLNASLVIDLISPLRQKEPKLYQALEQIANNLLLVPDIDTGNNYATVDGQRVTFNRRFKKVTSIQVSVASSDKAYYPSHTFNYAAENPQTFTVYIFDAAGNPVAAAFSWVAYGVL